MPKYSYGKDDDESSVGFGGTKPKQTKPKAAKTFNQLVRSIYRSTIMAQRKVDEQVVEHFLNRYFDKDGHPNLFRLSLPTLDGDPVEVDVPLITLTHGNHLNIKELEIDFEVELGHLEDIDNDDISAAVTSVNGKRMAKVKIKLDSTEPPEGIARIRQEMIKQLPS